MEEGSELPQKDGDTALQALSLPSKPSPDLRPGDVCLAICRGLQHVDVPTPGYGFERLFHFSTYECRAALTARRGKENIENFMRECTQRPTQALYPLLRCAAFTIDEPTVIAGTATRGALATVVVALHTAPGFRFPSGFERLRDDGVQRTRDDGERTRDEDELVRFTFQQERRPPMEGCWLLKELLPQRLQQLGDGDSGAAQG